MMKQLGADPSPPFLTKRNMSRRERKERRQAKETRRERKERRQAKERHRIRKTDSSSSNSLIDADIPWELPTDETLRVLSFLGPPDLDRFRGTSTYWTKSGIYRTACFDAFNAHRNHDGYANTPRDVALSLPSQSLQFLELPNPLQDALQAQQHPAANMVAPPMEQALGTYYNNNRKYERYGKETQLQHLCSKRGCSLARGLLASMMRQWRFRVVRPTDEVDWRSVPVCDLDGCPLKGVYRENLGSLLQAGDIVRLRVERTFDENKYPPPIHDENHDEFHDRIQLHGENRYEMTELNDAYVEDSYVFVKIIRYEKRPGRGRQRTFIGAVLPCLLEPSVLRMVLPGDRIWFGRQDIVQLPLAMNKRLKKSLCDRRRSVDDHMCSRWSMLDPCDELGPAPTSWLSVEASRVTDWGGEFLSPTCRALLTPGCTVRARYRTPPDDLCQIFVWKYFKILAIDPEDTDLLWGEFCDPYVPNPCGAVMRLWTSSIFEVPSSWNFPEFTAILRGDGTDRQLALTGGPSHQGARHVDVGNPVEWKIPIGCSSCKK